MRDVENYEVHQSDHSCNPAVLEAISMAKLTKNLRDYIDCMYGGKKVENLRATKETVRLEKRGEELKKEIGGEER